MSRSKEFVKNTAVLTIGKACTQFVNVLLIPLYTALLTTEEFGTFDVIISYATLFLPLVNWQFDQGLYRFMLDVREDADGQKRLFSSCLVSACFQCIIYFVLFLLASTMISIPYRAFLLGHVILHVFMSLLLQFIRGLGFNGKYAIASFISAATTTLLNVVFLVWLKKGITGLFISSILSQMITILFMVIASRAWRYFSVQGFALQTVKEVGRYSFPLIPNNLAWWVVNVSDRMVITSFISAAANGVYAIANKFPNLFNQFFSILNLSWTETVVLHYHDEDRDSFFSKTISSMFILFFSACICVMAAMPFVFRFFVVNESYYGAFDQIPILLFGMLFRVLVGLYSSIYVAQKNAKKIAVTSVLSAVINLSVDLLLIRYIHLFAASVSTLVAFIAMFTVRYIDVNRQIRIRILSKYVIYSVALGLLNILSYYLGSMPVRAVVLAVTVVLSVFINQEMLLKLKNMVLARLPHRRNS